MNQTMLSAEKVIAQLGIHLDLFEKWKKDDLMQLQCRLKVILQQKGIKLGDFAKTIGVNPGTLSCWISGRSHPVLKTALEISHNLGVSINEIWVVEEKRAVHRA